MADPTTTPPPSTTAPPTTTAAPMPWDDVEVPELDLAQLRKVWVQYSNTDLTEEGAGEDFPQNICWYESTAKRLAEGTYVLEGNGPIEPFRVLHYVEEQYVPIEIVNIVLPTKKDVYDQEFLTARQSARERALELGMTEEEIENLMIPIPTVAPPPTATPTATATATPTPTP